jgi:hypothetical protein
MPQTTWEQQLPSDLLREGGRHTQLIPTFGSFIMTIIFGCAVSRRSAGACFPSHPVNTAPVGPPAGHRGLRRNR